MSTLNWGKICITLWR